MELNGEVALCLLVLLHVVVLAGLVALQLSQLLSCLVSVFLREPSAYGSSPLSSNRGVDVGRGPWTAGGGRNVDVAGRGVCLRRDTFPPQMGPVSSSSWETYIECLYMTGLVSL